MTSQELFGVRAFNVRAIMLHCRVRLLSLFGFSESPSRYHHAMLLEPCEELVQLCYFDRPMQGMKSLAREAI